MEFVEANGAKSPAVGLGTWDLRGRTCSRVVEQALRLGYRHIDTAAMYDNEREVGEGLRASGVKRGEVFVTTKVMSANLASRDLERAAKESLARLRLTEVDLLLIHWPSRTIPALCKMKSSGFAKNIGVSNFSVALLEEALRYATEPFAVNQIEWHPFLDQSKVRAACAKHNIAVTAYSPIAKGKAGDDKTLKLIGMHHRKSAAQVSLRFLVQEGAVVIPRTSKIERLSENIELFDFRLDDGEMDEIRKLAHSGGRLVDMGTVDWD